MIGFATAEAVQLVEYLYWLAEQPVCKRNTSPTQRDQPADHR
jgi:hypothetical protein